MRTMHSADAVAAARPRGSWRIGKAVASALVFAASLAMPQAAQAQAQFHQQGALLVGTGAVGDAAQGVSALSADGNTAVVGGESDNSGAGAAWVFTRSNSVWTQQGAKLIGTGAVGPAAQGGSVALSADGNTAVVGGNNDNSGVGAAWVFTRSNGVWTQQGAKLVASDAIGSPQQGNSVALSADGNTAVVGGHGDNAGIGAAWVFTRSNGVWTQQGSKLIGNGAVGNAGQGLAVALSADGNTAVVGGLNDNSGVGAAWAFTRSNGVWTQQGSKLIGTGAIGTPQQGNSVALSADGNTAVVGGPSDNSSLGAAWVFTRSNGVWTQQGSKLVGTGAIGNPGQGASVALSADGNSAILGGPEDNSQVGAAWVFIRSNGVWTQQGSKLVGTGAILTPPQQGASVALSADGTTAIFGAPTAETGPFVTPGPGGAWIFTHRFATATHDFNGDGKSDILWQNSNGAVAMWLMNGSQVSQSGSFGIVASNWSVIGQRDFIGGGNADILWRDSSGNLDMWFMNGLEVVPGPGLGSVTTNWTVMGTADMNGDGKGDLLWQDTAGDIAIWFMNGSQVGSMASLGTVSPSWRIVGTSTGNILWRDNAGDVALWGVQGGQVSSSRGLGNVTSNFVVEGVGDFNGDGAIDILWLDTNSGALSIWFTDGTQVTSAGSVGTLPSTWTIAQIGDYNGDGMSDFLLLDSAGDLAVWEMNGSTVTSSLAIANVGTSWQVQNTNAN